MQRQNRNEYVYQRANEVMNVLTDEDGRKIKPFTEVLEQHRLKLLGHVLRRERQHPMHQSACKAQSSLPRDTEHRRVGRFRQFWTTTNMEKAWNVIKVYDGTTHDLPFYKQNRYMREKIIDQTQRFLPPFN